MKKGTKQKLALDKFQISKLNKISKIIGGDGETGPILASSRHCQPPPPPGDD